MKQRVAAENDEAYPLFFRLKFANDWALLSSLLKSDPEIKVQDKIELQLADLVKLLNPTTKLSIEESGEMVKAHLKGCPLEEYGTWVYYPWKKVLVHLLDEEEFIRVRTVRNLYKILPEEQAQLRTKKIGIIGLSVGQSVALALAMERIGGELRIADMDTIELSNLNRIRTSVSNLAVKKTVVVTREIAELDPYLKVVCFHEGLHNENIGEFLSGGGNLDLVAEECDDLKTKIHVRFMCRSLGIPVIMETSDSFMIDLERFDLDGCRQILHGFTSMENYNAEYISTNKDLLMANILEIPQLSERGQASLAEMGRTISNWPQLGTDVLAGGAITAQLVKEVLLGNELPSGRARLELLAHYKTAFSIQNVTRKNHNPV
ncbi:MAG: ThiF family adenylyltransferase [Flavobacteriales bacterium]|nr:ThiF family adenylyltransferase [Flavobacteriales bacterium]